VPALRLRRDVATSIVPEAMSNVLEHAHARAVSVSLAFPSDSPPLAVSSHSSCGSLSCKYITGLYRILDEGRLLMTPLTYQILLALADANRHGYGIIKELEARLGPGAGPSTGALYLALQRMEAEGLVSEARARPRDGDDVRRRYYRITRSGRAAAMAESARLEGLVETARHKRLLPEGGDA
jgi:DNA-binding PadR family transcriptional regulator